VKLHSERDGKVQTPIACATETIEEKVGFCRAGSEIKLRSNDAPRDNTF